MSKKLRDSGSYLKRTWGNSWVFIIAAIACLLVSDVLTALILISTGLLTVVTIQTAADKLHRRDD